MRTVAVGALMLGASQAHALDAFEIQVYDGTANPPGVAGIELHANTVASSDDQTHLTLEPSLGVTRSVELGAYLQTTLRPEGGFEWSGAKLRVKLVRPHADADRLRWGVNLEISRVPPSTDPDRWGMEVRPIVALTTGGGRLFFAFNPILDFSLSGPGAGPDPSFEPALTALYVVDGLLSAGIESYADFGPVGAVAPLDQQQHYLFEVMNVLAWKRVELNVGIGEGLTAASNPFVAKMILGFH
jgi:hypothetical protein